MNVLKLQRCEYTLLVLILIDSLRTSETSYLNEAFSFYSAIRQRSYYFQVNKEDRWAPKHILLNYCDLHLQEVDVFW